MEVDTKKKGTSGELVDNLYDFISKKTGLDRKRVERIIRTGSLKRLSQLEKRDFLNAISDFIGKEVSKRTGLRVLAHFYGDSRFGELHVDIPVSINRCAYIVNLVSEIVAVDDRIFKGDYFVKWLERTIRISTKSVINLMDSLRTVEKYLRLLRDGATDTDKITLIHLHFTDYTEPYPAIVPAGTSEKELQKIVDEVTRKLNKKYDDEWGFEELANELKNYGIKPIPIYDDIYIDVPK